MLAALGRKRAVERATPLTIDQYAQMVQAFMYDGNRYLVGGAMQQITADEGAKNSIVSSCIAVRTLVFSEIRFTFQSYSASRPGRMFGTTALSLLERPWPSASTGDLLARMEVDVSLFGNSYWVKAGNELVRLDPSKVVIMTGDAEDQVSGRTYGKRLVGYAVVDNKGDEVAVWSPSEVAHYRPLPDPAHEFRGASWLNAVLPDVVADREMTTFKTSKLRNGGTPNFVVTLPVGVTQPQVDRLREMVDSGHSGVRNAGKTLYLAGGADVKTVGANFAQLELKAVQGAGETRIAAAAGVPASIVGISEGLAGSALNSGNYTAARRRFADGTVRPLWRSACAALSTIVPPPDPGSRLWFDDRDVSFLQEDVKDEADIRQSHAQTIRTLVEAGFSPESAVAAVSSGDFTALQHTGLLSVQLQEPGATAPTT